jgi:hypothetical protein
VYTSHMQLGGPRVMGVNGVSHHVVADDLDGVKVGGWGGWRGLGGGLSGFLTPHVSGSVCETVSVPCLLCLPLHKWFSA